MKLTGITGRVPWTMLLVLLTVLMFPAAARAALFADFNEPYASATGPEVRMFDWTTQNCGDHNTIPDQPARAFRDSSGQVNLMASHMIVRRALGSTLGGAVHQCNPRVMTSAFDSTVSNWEYYEWISSPYTRDGTNVYALSHVEYQGWKFEPGGYCIAPGETWPDAQKCWYNVITLQRSTDGGATFSNSAAPTQFVGGPPYRYARGIGPIGFFNPSNIVRGHDGYYYALVHVQAHGAQPKGSCLWRTQDLSDPKSWRAWGGAGFTVRFLDPYVNNITDPAQHVCTPVGGQTIETGSESLTWSTYFKKWLLVRAAGGDDYPSGFYTYTSDDLVNWNSGTLMVNTELPWTHVCGEPDYVLYPSLLDPESQTRNFETTGQRPYLFFTYFNVAYEGANCWMSFDRDLMRIPIELSNQQPGGPSAALSVSTAAPRTGEPVTFDASGSRDADGTIVKHEWDLDGNGTYERDTGATPVTRKAYDAPADVTVTVRVSDDDGKGTDQTRVVRVAGGAPGAPGAPGAGAAGAVAEGSAAAPAAGAAPAGATAVPRFRVVGRPRARRNGSVSIRVRTPAAGRVAVRAAGRRAPVRRARARAARARTVVLRLRPTARGRALLARRGKVRFRVVISFRPVGGARQSQRRVLTMRLTR